MRRAGALRAPRDFPEAGTRLPAWAIRLTLLVVGTALTALTYGVTGWLAAGVALALAAAWAPERLLPWVLIVFLAGGELTHHPALTPRFLILLAGLHLLHGLAMLSLELPWRSWVSPVVLLAPLRRFVAIQVPAQLLAVPALALLAPGHAGHRPLSSAAIAAVGALAFAGVGLLLLGPRVRDAEPPAPSR